MDQDKAAIMGQALPLYALAPSILILILVLLYAMSKARGAPAKVLVFALGARPILSAMHPITFSSSPFGISWNALASILIFAMGIMVIRRRSLFSVELLPFYPLVIIALISGFMNNQMSQMASFVIKYGYLAVLGLATIDACRNMGASNLMKVLIPPLCAPLFLQIVCFVTGTYKSGENDGSASYIGGFYHEAAFSMLLLALVLAISLTDKLKLRYRLMLMLWSVLAIFLANYRTAIIALIPVFLVFFIVEVPKRFVSAQRPIIFAFSLMFLAAAGTVVGIHESDRFADIGMAWDRGSDLIKPPSEFSQEDRHIMSARPLIWSEYWYGWVQGDTAQRYLGFGPESWVGVFKVYAHNTLISALYELGIVGVIVTIFLWLWFLVLGLFAPTTVVPRIVAAHLTFIILSMATMPMWMIEGAIYYGVLCGYTVYFFGVAREGPGRRRKSDLHRKSHANLPSFGHVMQN